jgi:hypothetical protein
VLTLDVGTTVTLNESEVGSRGAPGIFQLSDDYIVESAALDPMLSTFWGIPGHDGRITDYSPQGWAARLDLQRRAIRDLAQVPSRSRGDRIAIEVMRERVQAELDLIESGEYHRWLSVLNGHRVHPRHHDYLPRESEQDWQNVRARLADVPPALDKLRESFLYAADNRQVAARRQALACAAQCSIWGKQDGFFVELASECDAMDLSTEAAGAAAAFTEFGNWLGTDYAAIATPHDPVGRRAPLVRPIPQRHRSRSRRDIRGGGRIRNISAMALVGEYFRAPLMTMHRSVEARAATWPRADSFLADRGDRPDDRRLDGVLRDRRDLRRCQVAAPAGGPEATYYTPPSETSPGRVRSGTR